MSKYPENFVMCRYPENDIRKSYLVQQCQQLNTYPVEAPNSVETSAIHHAGYQNNSAFPSASVAPVSRFPITHNTLARNVNLNRQAAYNNYCLKSVKQQTIIPANRKKETNYGIPVPVAPSYHDPVEETYIPQVVYDYVAELESKQTSKTAGSRKAADYNQIQPVVPMPVPCMDQTSVITNNSVSQLVDYGTEIENAQIFGPTRTNTGNIGVLQSVVPKVSINNQSATDIIPQVVHNLVNKSDNGETFTTAKKRKRTSRVRNSEIVQETRDLRNDLERNRTKQLKYAYQNLKTVMSKVVPDEKLTYIRVVKLATSYIKFLEHTISQNTKLPENDERKTDEQDSETEFKTKLCRAFGWWLIANNLPK